MIESSYIKPCIYVIRNLVNNKIYIGSTVNLKNRLNKHKLKLRLNKHHSNTLQKEFKNYPESVFIVDVLEEINELHLLLEREQYYLDTLLKSKSNNKYFYRHGYNIARIAGCSMLNRKHKRSTLQLMSESNSGKKNPMYGRKHKIESYSHTCKKVLQLDKTNNLIKEWDSMKDVERYLGFFQSNISACCNGREKTYKGYIWKFKNT